MAVALGTSSGFVVTAPSADPAGSTTTADGYSHVTHDVSPATAAKITEVGFWIDPLTTPPDTNFEIGLYAADGATVPGEAGTLLQVERTNATGGGAGSWVSVTGLNWSISSSTAYWLAIQIDDCNPSVQINYKSSEGSGRDSITSQTTLSDPFGGGALADADAMVAIYAVWEAAVATINTSINIGDAWKSVSGALTQINIGDAWKAVASTQINIGDAWKAAVFA